MQIYNQRSYNAIIFQPTTTCMWSCQGCYLKQYEKANNVNELDVPEWMAEVVSRVLEGKDIKANQVTFSLNHPKGNYLQKDYEQLKLYKFIRHVINELRRLGRDNTPEIHITMAEMSVPVYDAWGLLWDLYNVSDVVSISVDNFKSEHLYGIARRFKNRIDLPNTSFNCNLLVTPKVIEEANRFKPDTHYFLHNILCGFDTIYLIAHKPILGNTYSKVHVDSIKTVIELYNEVQNTIWKNQVFIDNCVKTCGTSKYTCEAGTNMMTIWPDGRVIGCPYATTGKMLPENNADRIIAQMLKMRERGNKVHDFSRCKMKELWKPIQK